jgi:DNA-binding beta-propeller fold protein YncE
MARPTSSRRPPTRPAWLALAAGLVLGCADTNAPPPEPLELLLVVNRQSNSLTIVSVDGSDSPMSVALGGSGSTPTTVAAREGIALVPLGGADAVAVVDLIGRVLMNRIDLPPGSGATGAAMLSDSIGYVANPGLNTISRINVFTGDTAEVPVGVTPLGFAVARGRLFVLNANLDETGEPAGSGWLTVINPATNATATGIDSIPLTGPGHAAFATPAADGFLYVVNRGRTTPAEGRLSVVDPLERREVASFAGLGLLPGELATDGRSRVFVSSLSEGLLEFNTDSNAVIRGEAEGVPIASNTGVAVDSRGRIYAIEAGGCAPGEPGVAHVLDEELEEIDRITLGRCSAGATVVRIGQEAGQDF